MTTCRRKKKSALCAVRKDRIVKMDATSGMLIQAVVVLVPGEGITVMGGRGVGLVTKPGLQVPVGERAINPVPRAMIEKEVEKIKEMAGSDQGCRVVISLPKGKEVARRTLNERLGIVGGLSVLGTTGINVPYSAEAFLASIKRSLEVARGCGHDIVVASSGRRSEKAAMCHMPLAEECFLVAGDHFDFLLSACLELGFGLVCIWAQPAKMAKLAMGMINTSSRLGELEISKLLEKLEGSGFRCPAGPGGARPVFVGQLMEWLGEEEKRGFAARVCAWAEERCVRYCRGELKVVCCMPARDGGLLGRSHAATVLLPGMGYEVVVEEGGGAGYEAS